LLTYGPNLSLFEKRTEKYNNKKNNAKGGKEKNGKKGQPRVEGKRKK